MIENMPSQKPSRIPQKIEEMPTKLTNIAKTRPLFVLAVSIFAAGWLSGHAMAAAPAQPEATDDLRAAFATPQDISEGKRVAQASCASCHGINGLATAKGAPNIAGQRAVYLHRELLVYKAGGRGDTPMNNVVKFLSDDALLKAAAYYASLDPALPAPAPKAVKGGGAPDPVAAGKAAASPGIFSSSAPDSSSWKRRASATVRCCLAQPGW